MLFELSRACGLWTVAVESMSSIHCGTYHYVEDNYTEITAGEGNNLVYSQFWGGSGPHVTYALEFVEPGVFSGEGGVVVSFFPGNGQDHCTHSATAGHRWKKAPWDATWDSTGGVAAPAVLSKDVITPEKEAQVIAIARAWSVDGNWAAFDGASPQWIKDLEANEKWANDLVDGAKTAKGHGVAAAFMEWHRLNMRDSVGVISREGPSILDWTANEGKANVRTVYTQVELYKPDPDGRVVAHPTEIEFIDTIWIDAHGKFCISAGVANPIGGKSGYDGQVVLAKRPDRRVVLVSKLERIDTAFKCDKDQLCFVYGPGLLGMCDDGSQCQGQGSVTMWQAAADGSPLAADVSEFMVKGTSALQGAIIPLEDIGDVRIQHEYTNFETKLIPKSDADSYTARGWSIVKPHVLTPQEEVDALRCDRSGGGDDKEEMLKMLKERGLEKTAEIPDYAFVQCLSKTIHDHITYDAGKDAALNNGKPPSHAFKTKVAQCGRFSSVMDMACRASGIPARIVCNNPRMGSKGEYDPLHMHVCAEVYIKGAGWCFIEPQGGDVGRMNHGYILTGGTIPSASQLADSALLSGPPTGGNINWAFSTFDKDNSGALDATESAALIASLFGLTPSDPDTGSSPQIQELITACDTNHDGKITKEELASYLGPISSKDWSFANPFGLGQNTCGACVLVGATEGDVQSKDGKLPGTHRSFASTFPNVFVRSKACEDLGMKGPLNPYSPDALASSVQLGLNLTYSAQREYQFAADGVTCSDIVSEAGNGHFGPRGGAASSACASSPKGQPKWPKPENSSACCTIN